MAKSPIRHPALIMEDGFLPPGMMPGQGTPMQMPEGPAGPMDPMEALADEGNGAPGAEPMKPSQEGEGDMEGEQEGASEVTPAMIDAGVKCLRENQDRMSPEDLVRDIYAAMEKAEAPEEGEGMQGEGNDPNLDMLTMMENA